MHAALIEPLLQASLPDTSKAPGVARGVDIGKAVADDLLSFRAADGSASSEPYKRVRDPASTASRFYTGLHFRFAVDTGLKQGRQLGEFAVTTTLLPRRAIPSTASKY